jgi:hypothetical protein
MDGRFDGLREVVQRPSPMPWIPSSVLTLANNQFFHGLPAMYVSTDVILI